MSELQRQLASNPERVRERAKTMYQPIDEPMPESEQTDDEAGTIAADIGEQPRDRDMMPGETLREPNAPADSSTPADY